ncbi:MAG: hypothetical protein KA076_06495 [Candidatus Marinimicrobia bacterium]|nr:hypothetical protein [Candidatus Neomarinimicrobiota bacterium]HPN75290.1 hypothetical protein [Candidatus Neomarinimicrobiota bacterium]
MNILMFIKLFELLLGFFELVNSSLSKLKKVTTEMPRKATAISIREVIAEPHVFFRKKMKGIFSISLKKGGKIDPS